MIALVYNQLFNENYAIIPNQNPADPAKWLNVGFAPLQVLNHQLCDSSFLTVGVSVYTGISWPADQWFEIVISHSGFSDCEMVLRSDAPTSNCYALAVDPNTPGSEGFAEVDLYKYINDAPTELGSFGPVPYVDGDIYRFGVQGTTLYVFRNGVLLGTATDTTFSSGYGGLFLSGDPNTLQLGRFTGGSITSVTAQLGSIISCSSARGNGWSVIFQYQLDSGQQAQSEVVAGTNGIPLWTSPADIILINAAGSVTPVLLSCPELVQNATFKVPFTSRFWSRTDSDDTDENFQYPPSPLD